MRRAEYSKSTTPSQNVSVNRLGFHYYPDALHYTTRDLQAWLPLLSHLNVGWLVLESPVTRAIPEGFIRSLLRQGISPLIQFPFSPATPPELREVAPIIEAYIKWGALHIQVFDRPNLRGTWGAAFWMHPDLAEAFVDAFLPWARWIVCCGGYPILPPLFPGGDYWDTAFLQNVLAILERRQQTSVIENLHLSAYAWTHDHPLEWGQGGPLAWPEARPYHQSLDTQDQRGFRIFEWYEAIAQSVLERPLPIHLYHAGLPNDPQTLLDHPNTLHPAEMPTIQVLYSTLDPKNITASPPPADYPPSLLSCNFWLLSASTDSPFIAHAWFQDGKPTNHAVSQLAKVAVRQLNVSFDSENGSLVERLGRPIGHYILLPPDWSAHPELIPKVLLQMPAGDTPTLGTSLSEAVLAQRVTLVEPEKFAPEVLNQLKASGCVVHTLTLGHDSHSL